MDKVDKEMDKKAAEKKVDHDKVYQVMKILTAMKLVKTDGMPIAVLPDLYIGSIGAAYNKKGLDETKITHILTCAANIKPSFPNVSQEIFFFCEIHCRLFFFLNYCRILSMRFSIAWIVRTRAF